jgi:hypothetical protein
MARLGRNAIRDSQAATSTAVWHCYKDMDS